MSEKTKYCAKCGASVDESVSFCPQCGNSFKNVANETPSPSPSPEPVIVASISKQNRGAMEHLTIAYNVAFSNLMVFVPTILSGIIGTLVSYLTNIFYSDTLSLTLGLLSSIISFIMSFAALDMSRDAYDKQAVDIVSSVNYVIGRIVPFIIASIFGALLSITVVLIPVVILTFVIMVIDETGIMDAFSIAFKVLFADLGDIILVLLVAIIGSWVFGSIPFLSTLLNSALNVIISLAFIDIYINYKK